MSITEAPDMTVARSSPWRCCGRPRKTSLGETGHKGGIRHEEDKKRREKGAFRKPVFADVDRGKCVRERGLHCRWMGW